MVSTAGPGSNSRPLGHESSPLPLDHGVLPLKGKVYQKYFFKLNGQSTSEKQSNNKTYRKKNKIITVLIENNKNR